MDIPDNILKLKLQNVYFIWGTGKTTAANELQSKHGFYVYHTDEERATYSANADPRFQPALCRDVPDYWALDPADARQWERDIVRAFTPMAIVDLLQLAARYQVIICEGDIDMAVVAPVATHAVVLVNSGIPFDFFDRPGQAHMLEEIRNRTDLTDGEREQRIANAYAITARDAVAPPCGVKRIVWDEQVSIPQTAALIEEYFGLARQSRV